MGRGKVQLKRIENPISRHVTFSKRKSSLLKKASELSLLCDAEVALIIFSPTGKHHEFASPSMNRIVEKYQKISASTRHYTQLSENVETIHLEMDNLQKRMSHLEKIIKQMIGEDLDSIRLKDLKNLEKQLNMGAKKIRSKKNNFLLRHIGSLTTKQRSLKEENANLRKKNEITDKNNTEIMEGVNGELERDAVTQKNLHQSSLNLSLFTCS